jgi:hypothetical protein
MGRPQNKLGKGALMGAGSLVTCGCAFAVVATPMTSEAVRPTICGRCGGTNLLQGVLHPQSVQSGHRSMTLTSFAAAPHEGRMRTTPASPSTSMI